MCVQFAMQVWDKKQSLC